MAKILVLDDDTQQLRAVERGLKLAGHTVVTATCPAKALPLFKAGERFDVVVSDLEMPGMQGDEFCREVQKIARVPFILVSGHVDIHVRARECGAARGFSKPVNPRDLYEALAGLIGEEAQA